MKKSILFVVDEMKYGGVSRVLCDLLSMFDYERYQVDVMVLHAYGEMLDKLPSMVRVIGGTSLFSTVDERLTDLLHQRNIPKILMKLRLILLMKIGLVSLMIRHNRRKMCLPSYDVEIAFKEGFCTLFVASGSTPRKINWIHSDYCINNDSKHYIGLLKFALRKIDLNIAVSETAAIGYQIVFKLDCCPDIIHNVININAIKVASIQPFEGYDTSIINFVTVGRLCYPKGYDRLVEIHATLLQRGLHHRIYVIGSGEDENLLSQRISQLGVSNTFLLLGYQVNPYPYMRNADLYVCSSRYEGLSISILESLALGTPVLATEVAGVREQLQGKYGLIVENTDEGLQEGLQMLLTDKKRIKNYRNNLQEYHYDNDVIMQSIYERLV